MRVEVRYKPKVGDGRSRRVTAVLQGVLGRALEAVEIRDVYVIDGGRRLHARDAEAGSIGTDVLREVFVDSVAQELFLPDSPDTALRAAPLPSDESGVPDGSGQSNRSDDSDEREWAYLFEIAYKPGVTDPVGETAREALTAAGAGPDGSVPLKVRSARQYRLYFDSEAAELIDEETLERAEAHVHNPLIQQLTRISRAEWQRGARPPSAYEASLPPSSTTVETFPLAQMNDDELAALSRDRLLALTLPEMKALRDYYARADVAADRARRGLPGEATDCELEMVAQTWSEHCKHKIFQALIDYEEDGRHEEIDGLFGTYIKATTDRIVPRRPDVLSVFHDNAGVVRFDEEWVLCFKAETHNSPSALDPYGGAITGIVGVNRDIIGTGKGAQPIFNTNVLCFGHPRTREGELPQGFLHPRTILDGVHRGIVDGGNQSGIPTVAGAILFDESYAGKPLVFCGTGGILPAAIRGEPSWEKHVAPGHVAVMVGGRIGKDGIHGATFSSLALDETSPTSAVQIGDPITQKKMLDFLLDARDRGLYAGITDNGAGGLSSSLGEMAREPGGLRLELGACPLKYPGLAPWEILVSESQERMSLAVPPDRLDELLDLARARDVEATAVGEFTDSGVAEIRYEGKPVGCLSLEFLHEGLPQLRLHAKWSGPGRGAAAGPGEPGPGGRATVETADVSSLREAVLSLLGDPNIASKEYLVRQYDHEVQGRTVGKPFVGARHNGPADGAVLMPRYDSYRGISVTHGVCPRYSDVDTYHMAMCAVDEALRAHVALGGDPDRASALDNFCWPDPVTSPETPDGAYKLAQLVRACRGLQEACLAYSVPLISGKDSMKNDARMGGRKVSVRPTLLISLMGIVPDIRLAQSSDFKRPGELIYLLGETRPELAGSSYERLRQEELAGRGNPADGLAPEPSAGERAVSRRFPGVPKVDAGTALLRYRTVHEACRQSLVTSVHDLSDGGLAIAAAESVIGGRIGARLALEAVPGGADSELDDTSFLFSESPSRFLVTVPQDRASAFEELFQNQPAARIGVTLDEPVLEIHLRSGELLRVELEELDKAWNGLNAFLGGGADFRGGGSDLRGGREGFLGGGGTA